MVQRVVYGNLPGGGAGLRVSKPGSNVLDANLQPKQVAFDSRWNRAGRVHMIGSVTGNTTISFGKTFPVCPLVFVVYTDASGRYRNHFTYGEFDDSGNLELRVTTTNMTFALPKYPATYVVVQI